MKRIPIGQTDEPADFSLPIDLVTQTIAILAKKGAGKSYTASVMVEGLLDAGQVPVIVDPTGAWWGLKSSADGKSEAYPMVVFGGEHADLPLEENAGEATARAIVEQRFPAIIDLSLFRKGQVKRFITPFLETIYRLNRLPLMLVVDEADDICPQKPFGDEAQMVGALEDVVKRGRKKGIGCTLITQRPADLAKQVLTQCEMLVAMRVSHPLDIKAVMEWVNVHADKQMADVMVASLPGLPIGTAWFWSPGWGDVFARVEVARRRTFDSGATPKAGEQAIVPKKMAQPDLVKIGGEIMASVERAKDNDPRELKKKIASLVDQVGLVSRKLEIAREEAEENQMAHMDMAKVAPVPLRVDVHVPVLGDDDRRKLESIVQTLDGLCMSVRDFVKHTMERVDRFYADRQAVEAQIAKTTNNATDERSREIERRSKLPALVQAQIRSAERASTPDPFGPDSDLARNLRAHGKREQKRMDDILISAAVGIPFLPEGERIILSACYQHTNGCTREQLTVLTGYKKSSRDTYLQRLRTKGYVQQVGERTLSTEAGVKALGPNVIQLPTGRRLREYWLERLPLGEKLVFSAAVGGGGNPVTREMISEATGYLKSSRDTYIQRLSARELVEVSREGVRASPTLF